MRKIKFKGKRKYCDEWVEGYYSYLFNDKVKEYIHQITVQIFEQANIDYPYPTCETISCEVIPETVGQFTGLTDKNGKEIYEGDIIEDKNGIGVIMWFQTAWGVSSYAHGYNGLKSYTVVDSFYSKETKEWAVIGSIHDNPELLTK